MCGITGFWSLKPPSFNMHDIIHAMNATLQRRGPDGDGVWIDHDHHVALAHRRLAIVDLSPAGHQPMHSASHRFVMNYNGEIFNAPDLQKELKALGVIFRGHSDTEVIIEAIHAWGVEKTVKKLIGMFAFAVWDRENHELYLVRDRLGIKPLYWGHHHGVVVFGSTVTAIKQYPLIYTLNHEALQSYMLYGYIPAPLSIYNHIYKMKPGHMGVFRRGQEPIFKPYWSLDDVIKEGKQNSFQGRDDEAINTLEDLLRDSVKRRMISDVPLGAFLSGGIDSSTVAALMQAQSSSPIKTFSIGFDEDQFNEAPHARAIATHLKTDHTEVIFTAKEASHLVPDIPQWYDEPFADSSQLPTYLVSKVAKRHVTVALSGDGGDELFAGYTRYHTGYTMWNSLSKCPHGLRKILGFSLEKTPPGVWQCVNKVFPFMPKNLAVKAQKFSRVLRTESLQDFYQGLIWSQPRAHDYLKTTAPLPQAFMSHKDINHPVEHMQYWDTLTYLTDDILTKVDRASMATSLEARVPLLDHRLVAFAWTLPLSMKLRGGQSKWLLRQVLNRYIPSKLMERPKMGFGIPIESWLKNDLRAWADDLLSVKALEDNPILDSHKVHALWYDFLKGKHTETYFLWTLMMMQAWLKKDTSSS